jgi:hypothetical protein
MGIIGCGEALLSQNAALQINHSISRLFGTDIYGYHMSFYDISIH